MPTAEAPAAPSPIDAAIDAFDTGETLTESPAAVVSDPKPEPKAPETPAAAPSAKPEPKPVPDDDLHGDLPKPAKPAPPVAAAPVPETEPKTNAELRERYNLTKSELATIRAEKANWDKQSETLKRTVAEESTKTLKAEIEALRKEHDEVSSRLKFVDYKSSPEFTDKYQKPLEKAWNAALTDIEGMTIENEDGSTQPVTSAHLQQLIGMPAAQAAKLAAKLFGPAAHEVLAHRRAIVGLRQASDDAITEWKAKGSEMSAAQERAQVERTTRIRASYDQSVSEMRESMPEIFGKPADAEAAAFFAKGDALVTMAMKGEGLPEGLTSDQRSERVVKAQAAVAARAAAFGSQRHALVKAESRVKELEAELASYKASGPTPAAVKPTQGASPDENSFEAMIDRLPAIE